MLSPIERQALLRLARESIAAHLEHRALPALNPEGGLDRVSGAFVTMRLGEHLRGCIGYPNADQPLVDVVRRCSISAATEDPRFPPLTIGDMGRIDLEISVLGPVEPVDDPAIIVVGRDGLIAERGYRRGLLLPQVALEWQWDRETFISQTCIKAGLPPDAWQKGAKIFRFAAEVFGEKEFARS